MALYDVRSEGRGGQAKKGRKYPSMASLQQSVDYYEGAGVLAVILELSKLRMTQEEIADELNHRGYKTIRGGRYCQPIVSRITSSAQLFNKLPASVEE